MGIADISCGGDAEMNFGHIVLAGAVLVFCSMLFGSKITEMYAMIGFPNPGGLAFLTLLIGYPLMLLVLTYWQNDVPNKVITK